jgi:hypothetical protein
MRRRTNPSVGLPYLTQSSRSFGWPPTDRWARRQITEWLPVGDDEPVCDECMLTFWRRLIVWDEPPGG